MKPKQPTSQELLDSLCEFVQVKFYPGQAVAFAKDRPRILKWVLLYPAGWLNSRGVTLPPERYKAILVEVLLDALRFGMNSKVTYLPAYLRQVVQSHFRLHGEKYYGEAKTARNLVEHAVLVAGKSVTNQASDPVRELAQAARILKARRTILKPVVKDQLNLL